MKFRCTGDGVVTLLPSDAASTAPPVECLMCAYEPLIYDTLADFLPSDSRCAEVGSFKGGSACILWHGMTRRDKNVVLACHDIFDPFALRGSEHDIEAAFDANVSGWGVGAVKVKGDSKKTHVLHPDGSLDYCFIDGDHTYDGALADLRLYSPKVKPGGFFVVQDSIHDVDKAITEAMSKDLPRVIVEPPYGHFVTIFNSDNDKLHAFARRFVEVMDATVRRNKIGCVIDMDGGS